MENTCLICGASCTDVLCDECNDYLSCEDVYDKLCCNDYDIEV